MGYFEFWHRTGSSMVSDLGETWGRAVEYDNRWSRLHGPSEVTKVKAQKRRRIAGMLLTLATAIQSACAVEEPNRDRVDFLFTDAEWKAYGRRIKQSNRSDFSLSVRMGEHWEAARATAHLRGKGSFGCARRNYTLNLYGKRPRFASLDSVTDEFYLLSMCLDHGYVRQHTVLKLWSQLGLFPMQLRYVELTLNGSSRGVYLLVEKLDRIRFSRSGLRALLRRNFSSVRTLVEVKYSRTGEQEARADYEKTLEEFVGLSGERLVARFRERMNLDQYLLWIASNALLQNGDSVDELWLLAEDNPTPQAGARPYYTFFAWDPDDVFNVCHLDGRYAFRDPYELTYCAEAEWDHILLGDPVGYALYVDVLEDLVETRLKPRIFDDILRETSDALLPFMARENVASAMLELFPSGNGSPESDRATAEATIRDTVQRLSQSFERSSSVLEERIARYRESVAASSAETIR